MYKVSDTLPLTVWLRVLCLTQPRVYNLKKMSIFRSLFFIVVEIKQTQRCGRKWRRWTIGLTGSNERVNRICQSPGLDRGEGC